MNYSISPFTGKAGGIDLSSMMYVSDSNWTEFCNVDTAVLIFEKSDCEKCQDLSQAIHVHDEFDFQISKLRLDEQGSSNIKQQNSWISNIDILPYCALFRFGQLVDSWASSDIQSIIDRVENNLGY
jgi:hypothetical protein